MADDSNPDYENLRRVVKRERERLGLSQGDVAAHGGPSDTTLSQIEAGTWRSARPARTLSKLDQALGWAAGVAAEVLYAGLREPAPNRYRPDPDPETARHLAGATGTRMPGDLELALNQATVRADRLLTELSELDDRLERLQAERVVLTRQLVAARTARDALIEEFVEQMPDEAPLTEHEAAQELAEVLVTQKWQERLESDPYDLADTAAEAARDRPDGKPSRSQQKRAEADRAGTGTQERPGTEEGS